MHLRGTRWMRRKGGLSMRTPARFIATLWVLIVATAAFGQDFNKAQYYSNAAPGQKKADPVKGTLRFDTAAQELQFRKASGETVLAVKKANIKSITYERAAKPRYAAGLLVAWPLLFTKSKSHFLTVQYDDEKGQGHYAIVKLDKSNFRDALASIEAQTGKRIERHEES
jgi:hypothetical protein